MLPRHCQTLLAELLRHSPCVAVVGVRQCGKTTLLDTLGSAWQRFDLERRADREQVEADPDLFLRLHPERIAIDEAQLSQQLFGALRVAIDERRRARGRFVLTGSSSPELSASLSESLAGRVGLIELGPLSLAEAWRLPPSLVVDALVERWPAERIAADVTPRLELRQVHRYWLHGGYPEPWTVDDDRFRELWADAYVQTYLYRDLGALFPGLDKERFRAFLGLLAGLSGTTLNFAEVARALAVSQPTARRYFDIADGTFLWRKLPAFTRDALGRVNKRPRGYLRDTGLLHHLMRVRDVDVLRSMPWAGASFESMVIEQILRGIAARGVACEATWYRTAGGAEIDLVLEGPFGLVPVEIKSTSAVSPRQLRPLRELVRKRGCRIGLVVHQGDRATLYDEDLVGVPVTAL